MASETISVEKPANPKNMLNLPPPGFGQFEVAEMPAYIQGYSKRGNSYDGETSPVYQQARWGNKRLIGGMAGYLSQVEDDTYFEGYKQKKGNTGVFSITRWSPGYDWRGNFGVASLGELNNYAGIPTRGGMLRKGGPKRSDYIDRPNYWVETTRPGVGVSRYTQNANNYAGIYGYKKQTPRIQTSNDMLVLREMIEHNGFHINSHGAKQAKKIYDKEFGNVNDRNFKAYQDHIDSHYSQFMIDRPDKEIKETSPYMTNRL